jgi:hypothetical protein
MAYEQKDNSGSLWVNDRKESDTHPDRTGSAMIDGKAYWVNGWIKKSDKGQWLSLAFKPKEAAPARKATAARKPTKDDMDDIIPF